MRRYTAFGTKARARIAFHRLISSGLSREVCDSPTEAGDDLAAQHLELAARWERLVKSIEGDQS